VKIRNESNAGCTSAKPIAVPMNGAVHGRREHGRQRAGEKRAAVARVRIEAPHHARKRVAELEHAEQAERHGHQQRAAMAANEERLLQLEAPAEISRRPPAARQAGARETRTTPSRPAVNA
jgi:hypothetical protein